MRVEFLIVGAGPTGLGAAHRLKELGRRDFLVVERDASPGGLARSFVDDEGFTWDIGGHVHFSGFDYYNRLLDRVIEPEGWIWHERDASIWIGERFVPYPFQTNLRHLPNEDVWRCVRGLLNRRPADLEEPPPSNFLDWIYRTFGDGIAELFMVPYNEKVWACGLDAMSSDWIAERVAPVQLARVLEHIFLRKDDVSWGPNNRFRFPREGGTGSLWNRVADRIGTEHFRYGAALTAVDAERHLARFDGHEPIEYEHLLSTVPLNLFCRAVQDLPAALQTAADSLVRSTTHIVGLGLRGQCRDDLLAKKWIYFPESNCPFYRATVFSNYSPTHTPDASRFWSLMTETSESSTKMLRRDELIDETIRGAIATGLVDSSGSIISTWLYAAPYGYPVPSLARERILSTVLPYLEQRQLFSRGRFGAWRYEVSNQDHSFMQGVELADRLCAGRPESTFAAGAS